MRGGKFFESKTATIDSKPVDSLSNRTRRSVANATIILACVAFDPGLEPMGQNEGNGFVEPQPDYFGRTTLGDDLSHPRRSHATRYGEHINNNFTVSSMEIQIRSFLFGGRHVLEVSISVVVVISPQRCDARVSSDAEQRNKPLVLLEQIPTAFIDSPKRDNILSAVTFVACARGEDGEP